MKEIILAGGCFWGIESYFNRIEGVVETKVGYANGTLKNPSYDQVKKGDTGHAEAVYIKYDEQKVALEDILEKFWKVIDPTLLNQQGPDKGHQYRTGVYYVDASDLDVISTSKDKEQVKYDQPIVTEIEALKVFYEGEEYHQKYLAKNPGGYCHIDLSK